MTLWLLDSLPGDLVLRQAAGDRLVERDRLDCLRLDSRDRLQMVASQEPHGPHDVVDPIWHLTRVAVQEPQVPIPRVQAALAPLVANWVRPHVEPGDQLLLLFQPGLPEAFRQALLEEVGRLSHPSLVAGFSPGLLALWAAEHSGPLRLGNLDWYLEAEVQFRIPGSHTQRELQSLRVVVEESATMGEQALLTRALQRGARWLEGDISQLEIGLDLQPHLLVRQGREGALELASLECGSTGVARLHGWRPGWLWLGCGRGSHWSGAEALAAVHLEARGALELEWQVDSAMNLDLHVQAEGSMPPVRLRRTLPRPLIIALNRLKADPIATSTALEPSSQQKEHAA